MKGRMLSLIVAIVLAMSVSMPISAEPLTQQLDNQSKQLLEQQNSYAEAQKNLEKLEISIEKLDSKIESIYAGIDKAKGEIYNTEKKIEQTTKEIVIAENNIKGEEALFNKRMRVMFMNGADSYLEILLDSEGLEDFISRIENVKKIVEYDNKIIRELNEKKNNIEERKKYLNDNKVKALTLKADNENKLDELSIKKKEQNKLIVEAEKQQKLHKNEITETQQLIGSTMSQIKEISNKASKHEVSTITKRKEENNSPRSEVNNENKNQTSSGAKEEIRKEAKEESRVEVKKEVSESKKTSAVSSNEVVAYAESFMGTPYEWGAGGPETFDCSGFVKYVYAHFGVSLDRSTYDQINQGEFVSRENLQSGDLVFFGTGSPHHVGIYVGNNTYIHAPRTGDVVKESPLTRSDYMTARRIR